MNRGYEKIPRELINDMSLSLKALGLLVRIQRLPKDWNFSINGLSKISGLCAEATASIVNELIKSGYCIREKKRDAKGHIIWSCTFLTEKPHTEKPHTEKPHTEKPHTEKPHTEKPHTRTRNNINIITRTKGALQTGALQKNTPQPPEGEPELSYENAKTKEQKQECEKAFLLEHSVNYDTPLFNSLMDWFQFRRDIKKPFKTTMQLERCLKQVKRLSNGKTEIAIEIIDQSIANGWQGLFELKQKSAISSQVRSSDGLVYGERIVVRKDGSEYRTYGNSGAVIPLDAPHRPSWDSQWDSENQHWFRE